MKKVFFTFLTILTFEAVYASTSFFSDKTKIENITKLRDPFQSPKFELPEEKLQEKSLKRNGIYTNINGAGELSLSDLDLQGLLIGKNRRAIINKNGQTLVLKEGMKIGKNGAEIKAILPGGIVLVEQIKNIYGEDEILETVIPFKK